MKAVWEKEELSHRSGGNPAAQTRIDGGMAVGKRHGEGLLLENHRIDLATGRGLTEKPGFLRDKSVLLAQGDGHENFRAVLPDHSRMVVFLGRLPGVAFPDQESRQG